MMSALTVSSLPFQPAASALALASGFLVVVVILDAAVAVLVGELQQAGLFPALHPVRTLVGLDAAFGSVEVAALGNGGVHRGVQVVLGHRGNSGAVVYSRAMKTSAQPAELRAAA
jgi:hypothetical protein